MKINPQNFFDIKSDPQSDDFINDIISIQLELTIAKDLLAKGQTEPPKGVLISAYTKNQICEELKHNATLLAAYAKNNSEPVGYLFAISGYRFLLQHPNMNIEYYDKLKTKYSKIFQENGFVYLSQLGVRFAYQGTRVADFLLNKFEIQNCKKPIVLAVLKEPLHNLRSFHFFKRNNYIVIGELHTPNFGEISNLRSYIMIKY